MQFDKLVAGKGPQKATGPGAGVRKKRRTIPSESGSALGPGLGRRQECVAVIDELAPPVERDTAGRVLIAEAPNPIDPTRRDGRIGWFVAGGGGLQ